METRTTCCYCGVGCGIVIEHDGTRVTGVRGDPDHPVNRGQLCTKGQALHETMTPQALRLRATLPLRRSSLDEPFTPCGWDGALEDLADRFADCIRTHGPDSVAFYISGQLTTEDYYVFNKLAKGLIGTNNVDTNSRLCMSSAVTAYKQTLGADAPPCCYEDVDHADLIVVAGSNTAWAHPVLYRRIEAARARNPALRVIAVDPRRTATAQDADLHLAIEPGTDVALFHGLLHLLLWDERVDSAFIAQHTEGFGDVKAIVRDYTPAVVAQTCGIAEADLVTAARWFGAARAVLSLYCQGLNQSTSGTAKNAALINLHLATGQIGRPGAGPFSLTGQPNAMGGREVGGMATLLSAHRDLADAAHRAEVAALWGVDDVPARPGKTAVELFDALASGEVRMAWIACTNPAQSMPDQARVRRGLARAQCVVLQEAYAHTETAAFAHVLLPAASWGEKDGTMTNSERRIGRVRAAVPPPGSAREDWRIVVDFARRLERRLDPARGATRFPYETAAAIFAEHAATTRGRDLDITGLDYATLDQGGPQPWPYPAGAAQGTARLYEDRRFATADGRARFAAVRYAPPAEAINAQFPFRLVTARLRDQWHGMTRTGTVARLHAHTLEPALGMHPADLARRSLAPGALVVVRSRRGALTVPVAPDDTLHPGTVSLPMHWGAATLCGAESTGINAVTHAAVCPQSRQPELKFAAVRVEAAALPWSFTAFALAPDGDAHALRDTLRAQLREAAYASVVLLPAAGPAVLARAAAAAALPDARVAAIDAALGLSGADALRYDDARRGISRRARVDEGRLTAVRLVGEGATQTWLRDWLAAGADVQALRSRLLLPATQPPSNHAPRGRVVCTCFGVTDTEIRACAATHRGPHDAVLAHVQHALRCGSNCGSCRPELRRLVAEAQGETVGMAP